MHRRWRIVVTHSLPWILLIVALALVASQVRRPSSLVRVWIPWAEVGSLALVMTPIILTGGIDLSVGSTISLCAVVMGVLWQRAGIPIELAAMAGVLAGLAAGGLNGFLIVLGLSPLVATLATMAFYAGLAMTISGSERITDFPEHFTQWSTVAGVPTHFWLLLVTALSAYVVVHHTTLGRWCFAIGDNRLAARFAAVPAARVEWFLYTASGLVAALVGVFYTIDRGAAVPDSHQGIELRAIACVVVGGTLITGGRGGIPRTLLGLAVIANLDIGLEFLGTRVPMLSAETRLIVIGLLLVVVAIWNERLTSDARLVPRTDNG